MYSLDGKNFLTVAQAGSSFYILTFDANSQQLDGTAPAYSSNTLGVTRRCLSIGVLICNLNFPSLLMMQELFMALRIMD